MYRCESWTLKKAEHQRTDGFEPWSWRRLFFESHLDSKEIKPVNPTENQFWIFIGRTVAEAPILWPPDVKSWLTGKDPDAGKDWRRKEKGRTEKGMAGWHHWLDGHEFQQALGVGVGQGILVCCSPWGRKESDTTERLIWSDLKGRYMVDGDCFMPPAISSCSYIIISAPSSQILFLIGLKKGWQWLIFF